MQAWVPVKQIAANVVLLNQKCVPEMLLLQGQTISSSVRGTVTDATGAVVAGAQISVVDTRSSARVRSVSSDANGNYEVPDMHEAKKWFESLGKRVLGEPRIGAHGTPIVFVHPKEFGGMLVELMEEPKDAH